MTLKTETPKLSNRFEQALVYAAQLHANQLRKSSGIPYISHLLSVAALVLEDGGDEEEAIAALLHDSIEDCGGAETREAILALFGERIVNMQADGKGLFLSICLVRSIPDRLLPSRSKNMYCFRGSGGVGERASRQVGEKRTTGNLRSIILRREGSKKAELMSMSEYTQVITAKAVAINQMIDVV